MNSANIQPEIDKINALSREEMCRLWRFAKAGECPYFDMTSPLWPIFEKRFRELGGFTPEISKSLGW